MAFRNSVLWALLVWPIVGAITSGYTDLGGGRNRGENPCNLISKHRINLLLYIAKLIRDLL